MGEAYGDDVYAERASRVGGAVVWSWTATAPGRKRVLPDGCMDIIVVADRLMVAGPDTRAHEHDERPGDTVTGLRFAPGTAPAVLGVPAGELRDRRVPLDAVWPGREVRLLAQRVAEAPEPGAELETTALARLSESRADRACLHAVERLRRGDDVAAVARALGLGERQLHRRCLAAFGYGPKTLSRVLRMQRALELARAGRAPVDVAATVGYSDQAHLSRDVRQLAGVPLAELR